MERTWGCHGVGRTPLRLSVERVQIERSISSLPDLQRIEGLGRRQEQRLECSAASLVNRRAHLTLEHAIHGRWADAQDIDATLCQHRSQTHRVRIGRISRFNARPVVALWGLRSVLRDRWADSDTHKERNCREESSALRLTAELKLGPTTSAPPDAFTT